METVRLIDFLIFISSGILGWVAKVVWDDLKQMRRDFDEMEKGLPKEYVRKAEWDRATDRLLSEIRDFRQEMTGQFDTIWKEMRGKQDRAPGHD